MDACKHLINMNNIDVINKLQAHGYKTTNRGLVQKYSKKTRRYEVAGQVNNAGVYFYAQNVAPFNQGQNTLKDLFGKQGSSVPQISAKREPIETRKEHSFSFEDYLKTTKQKNQFSLYANRFNKDVLGSEQNYALYDIRGVKNGYLEDAAIFPYININNEFQTAKIVKYNSITGKRNKGAYSNNWFHSYKPIKKELGISGDITKSANCFFGEHLLSLNSNPVVIVEAEKTAKLLSLGYPNTTFIATGGLTNLERLDYSFLLDRRVFLFPDSGAKEWFKIAEKRGWWCSNILEDLGKPGEDIADYFTTFTTDEERNEIFLKLHDELWCIDEKEFDGKNVRTYSLNFENKKKLSFNYSLPIPRELNLNYYYDNAKGRYFKGKHFNYFENDFKVLNANIDFNKTKRNEFGWQQLDAKEFLVKLEKCFRIVKHLNPDIDHPAAFSKILQNLLINSNHTFNISYVERVLVPLWNGSNNEIEKYYKWRNWRFSSKDTVEKKDFVRFKNNDAKLFSINQYLTRLKPLLKKNEFILPEQIDLHHKAGNEFVWNIIKRFNKNVLGCSTIANYKSKLKVFNYLEWCINQYNALSQNEKLYTEFDSTYYIDNIDCKERCTTFKIPSVLSISNNTGVHRKIINEYLNFEPDANELNNLILQVNEYLLNPLEFSFERVNSRIVATPKPIPADAKEIEVSVTDAFDYPLDLKDSVLNIDESERLFYKGDEFITSWIYFNNKNLTESEILEYKINPMAYFREKETQNINLSKKIA